MLTVGARLTAYELVHDGLPATLICDSMAAALMAEGRVDAVVVGADRVAANGDTANKIGTYSLAVLASFHKYSCPYLLLPILTALLCPTVVSIRTFAGFAFHPLQVDITSMLRLPTHNPLMGCNASSSSAASAVARVHLCLL